MNWLEKYRPVSLDEYIGIKSNIKVMLRFIEQWQDGYRSDGFLILHGIAGVGKTTFVHAAANEVGLTIMEINASDSRRKSDLQRIGDMAALHSYDDDGRLLLLDEADGISDWSAIKPILMNPMSPIILTANDLSKIPYEIRKQATIFNLTHPQEHQRRVLIERICEGESLTLDEESRSLIAQNSTSWRSVINMLSTMKDGQVDAEHLVRINEGGDEVVRILKGERILNPSCSTGKIMRWAAHNGGDAKTIQYALHFQEAKKTTGLVGSISESLIMTLRVESSNIEAPPFYERVKKHQPKKNQSPKKEMPDIIKKDEPQANNNSFGGFFS